eukprot:762444-Pleurochrysis_carterae.AAC.1
MRRSFRAQVEKVAISDYVGSFLYLGAVYVVRAASDSMDLIWRLSVDPPKDSTCEMQRLEGVADRCGEPGTMRAFLTCEAEGRMYRRLMLALV